MSKHHRARPWHQPMSARRVRGVTRAAVFARRRCRVCGCTNNRACPGGCYWVAIDLCSKCAVEIGWLLSPSPDSPEVPRA